MYLQANFAAESAFTVDMGVERTQDYGFSYSSDGGYRDIDKGPTTKFSNPAFAPGGTAAISGKISAGFGPTLKAALLIYGFAGPTLTVGAQAGASASIVQTGDGPKVNVSLYIGGEIVVAVELTVPIIEKKILDAVIVSGTYKWVIKSWRWGYIETFPGPTPTPTPTPTPIPPRTLPTIPVRVGQTGLRLPGHRWSRRGLRAMDFEPHSPCRVVPGRARDPPWPGRQQPPQW